MSPIGYQTDQNRCYDFCGENTDDTKTLKGLTEAIALTRRRKDFYNCSHSVTPTPTEAFQQEEPSDLTPTAQASKALYRRHLADKLAQLSQTETSILSFPETENLVYHFDLDNDFVDEEMALHLGKKLAQVLGTGAGNGTGSSTDENKGATTSSQTIGTSEMGIFNISKSKKIELQNLSSRISSPTSSLDGQLSGK